MRGLLYLLAAVAAGPLAAQTDTSKPFDRWALERIRTVSDLRLSPDGARLAFVVQTSSLSDNAQHTHIHTVPLNAVPLNASDARRVTLKGDSNSRPRWAPDSQRLAFISNRSGQAQVWIAEIAGGGGDARQVTTLSTGVEDLAYSPDGERLFFISRVYPDCGPDDACNRERLQAAAQLGSAQIFDDLPIEDLNYPADARRRVLFSLSLTQADAQPLALTPLDGPAFGLGDFAISPDGAEVCYAFVNRQRPQQGLNLDLFTVPATGGEPTRITAGSGADRSPVYSPDGAELAYLSQQRAGYPADRYRLLVHDRETGRVRDLTDSLDRSVHGVAWSPDSSRLFFTVDDQGRRPAHTVRRDGGGLSMVIYGNAVHSNLQVAPGGGSILYLAQSASRPPEVVQGFATGEQPRRLTHLNDALFEEYSTGEVDELKWKSDDGTEISGFLVKPPDLDFTQRYPLVMLLHAGAGDAWGERWSASWNAQVLAGAGYVAFLPNPRGSGGFGARFQDAVRGDWTGLAVEDLLTGLDHVLARPYVDATRLTVAARGRGAGLLGALLQKTGRFRAAVVDGALVDARTTFGSRREPSLELWRLYGAPWEKPENYGQASIWPRISDWKTPTLLLHGERDTRSPAAQSVALFRALRRLGTPARLALFPSEGARLQKPRNRVQWYSEVVAWLDQWTAPAAGAATSPDSSSAPK